MKPEIEFSPFVNIFLQLCKEERFQFLEELLQTKEYNKFVQYINTADGFKYISNSIIKTFNLEAFKWFYSQHEYNHNSFTICFNLISEKYFSSLFDSASPISKKNISLEFMTFLIFNTKDTQNIPFIQLFLEKQKQNENQENLVRNLFYKNDTFNDDVENIIKKKILFDNLEKKLIFKEDKKFGKKI
jgi:hypothetical protein